MAYCHRFAGTCACSGCPVREKYYARKPNFYYFGWICARCGRSNSHSVLTCACAVTEKEGPSDE